MFSAKCYRLQWKGDYLLTELGSQEALQTGGLAAERSSGSI